MVGLTGDDMVFLLSVISTALFVGMEHLLLKKAKRKKLIYATVLLVGTCINMLYLAHEQIHAVTIPFMVFSALYFFKGK